MSTNPLEAGAPSPEQSEQLPEIYPLDEFETEQIKGFAFAFNQLDIYPPVDKVGADRHRKSFSMLLEYYAAKPEDTISIEEQDEAIALLQKRYERAFKEHINAPIGDSQKLVFYGEIMDSIGLFASVRFCAGDRRLYQGIREIIKKNLPASS